MKAVWRRWLYRAGLMLGSLLLGVQAWLTFQSLQKTPVSVVAPWSLLGAWGAVGLATVIQIAAWQVIMNGLGIEVGRWRLAQGYMVPFLARYIPGSVWGYLGRSQWLYQNYQIPYSKTNFASALEVLSVLTTASLIIFAYLGSLSADLVRLGWIGLAIIAAPTVRYPLQSPIMMHLVSHVPGSAPYVETLAELSFRTWAALVGLHVLLWLCYGVALRLTIGSLVSTGLPSLMASSFMFTVAWLIGFLVLFIPAGLGVRELTLSNLLMTVATMSSTVGSVVVLLLRALLLITEVAFVTVFIVSSFRARRHYDNA